MYAITKGSCTSRPRVILSSSLRHIRLVCLGLLLGFFGLQSPFGLQGPFGSAPSAHAQSVPVTVGYRDFNYGTAPSAEITAEKAESKLWWNDGFWWGVLWADSTNRYRIHQFNVATQSWINTGVAVDTRTASKADVLWDGQKLYIVSHIHTSPGPTGSANAARLYRFSYDSGAKTYSLDAGFPVLVNSSRSETLVLEKDSTGQLWITWTESGKVMFNRTTGDDLTWGTPLILPVQGNDISLDDISSVVAFGSGALPGGNKIGIMWSNQVDKITYFAVHRDSDADLVWQPREQALVDPTAGPISDDHINLKACAGSDEVYAVTKTSLSGADAPWIVVVNRDAAGIWTSHVVATRGDGHTQPVMLIDRENQKFHVFAKSAQTGTGIMYMKSADLSTLQFAPGLGTPFIQSDTDFNVNDPTSTKQCVDSNTGLLLLASDENTRFYLHNYIDLSGGKPVITTFSPTSGTAGTQVTITGSNFTGVTDVVFNGTAAAGFTVNSDTQIRATVPSGASTGKISVTNAAGTGSSAADFVFGTSSSGVSFAPLHDARVRMSTPTTNYGSSGSLRVQTDVDIEYAYLKFEVTGLTAPPLSARLRLYVTNPSADGGSVHLVSNNLQSTTTEWTESGLSWDNAPAIAGTALSTAGTVSLDTFIELDVTSAIVGNGTYSFGIKSSSTDRVEFSSKEGLNPPELLIEPNTGSPTSPRITSFTPGSGPVGTQVTIAGSNFIGATNVAFNGTAATGFTVDSDTQIRATVPAAATTGKISVTNSSGTGLSATNFAVTQVPVIASFAPVSGPAGTEVTIAGNNFTGATNVAFNGTAAAGFTVDSGTQIRTNVPTGATTGKISVTNADGTGFSATNFAVTTLPTITSFTPTNGPIGTEVTITGGNFTGTIEVTFNSRPASGFIVDSNTQIRATVPTGATTGKISVTNSFGTGFSAGDFAVTQPPIITSFTPASGPEGTEVTINGSRLAGATNVAFNGVFATSFTVFGDTQIRAIVPAGATTGKIGVSNFEGTGLSATDFVVTPPVPTTTFTPIADAYVRSSSLTGNFGASTELSLQAGTTVYKTYLKFNVTGLTGTVQSARLRLYVTNPGPDGGSVFAVSNNYQGTSTPWDESGLTWSNAPTLSGAPLQILGSVALDTRVEIEVTPVISGNGTYSFGLSNNSNDRVIYSSKEGLFQPELVVETSPIPIVTSFTPSNGPVGSEVTISGFYLNGAIGVAFNGTSATSFTVISETQIRAQVPAGASTGKISVTNSTGSGFSTDNFIVTAVPAITAFTPANGPVGAEVTITGTNFVAISSVTFNGTPATNFTADSNTQLRAIVPSGATTGKIGVTNSAGTASSAGDFAVTPLPVITAFAPGDGPVGTEATITGTGFILVTGVSFNGVAANGFTVDSETQIRANVPAGATTGKIGVTNSAGTGLSANDFIVTAVPAITTFTPNNGPVGAQVTLTGANFAATTGVTFNGIAATGFTVVSNTQLRAIAPPGATTGKIGVTNSAGTGLTATDFVVTTAPAITSFTPGNGVAGAEVTVTGTNFIAITGVTFNGIPPGGTTSFTVDSGTQLRVNVPPGATTGKIGVTNSAGTGLSAVDFEVMTITAFTPGNGPTGTQVTITGTHFVGITGVIFNGTAATSFTVDSETQIRATVPPGAATGKIGVTNAMGTALSANNFTVAVVPVITSFTPLNGPAGTVVTIDGSSFAAVTSVTFNGTPAISFTVPSSIRIRATVPAGATTGKIAVTNSAGTGVSTNDFTVTSVPVITSFTPNNGPIGTQVTITGNNFTGTTGVTFNGTAATSLTVDSDTQIRAHVPPGTTTGKIGVTNSAGSGLSTNDFIITQAPVITSFTPASGIQGTEVTIAGSNFAGITSVAFNGTPATSFTVDSGTRIRANVPVGATTGKISVTNSAGTGLSGGVFTVIPPPSISSFTPSDGPVGTVVTIAGIGFTNASGVAFNGDPAASFTVDSDAQIRATVPAGATTGKIGVTTATGTGSSANNFIITQPPALTSFTPANGPVGSEVTLTGINLTATSSVTFNGTPAASFTVDSDTQLRANVPAGATTGKIRVTNSSGTALSTGDFIVTAVPAITSFTPNNGVVGTEVTINGSNFVAITSVTFNGIAAASFTVDSNTKIRATVPPAANTGKIRVINSAGAGVSTNDFGVMRITAFTPGNGPVGTEVTLTGTRFTSVTQVAFNGTMATSFTIDSNTQIRANVPAGATTGKIGVTNSVGTALSANDFVVTVVPVITSFTPSDGPISMEVTLTGNHFAAATGVTFNGIPASSFTVDSNTQLRAVVPEGATTGKIRVTNSAGFGVSASDFVITVGPAISSFTPRDGGVGTPVTITGHNFIGVTGVAFNGTATTDFSVDSDTEILVNVPPGATTGKIGVTNSAGTALSANDFIVTYPPAITSFTPTNGPVGTQVTITGTNFAGITAVAFNGTPAASFTVDSNTRIRATVPAGATTGKIGVTNSSGSGISGGVFAVKPPPVVSSFTPDDGPVGTQVTITGNHFTGATAVAFNGTAASSFTVVSSTQLSANVPAGATTGKISVTTADGTGSSADNFIVTSVPVISAFSPGNGPVGAEVTLTGIHFTATTSVTFNGTPAINFTVDSDTQLRAEVPPGATTGRIGVANSAGIDFSAVDFIVTNEPAITSFSPGNGPVGTEVTLTGANFIATTSVTFNGIEAASFTIDSETQLRANVPVGASTGKIGVANSAGTGLSAVEFIVTSIPAITSFTPSDGPVNTEVTLTGMNFSAITSVTFNGTEATSLTVDSDTQIRAHVPSGATTGKIAVINSAGTALSTNNFIVTAVPAITSLTPANGIVGTAVTLTGTHFAAVTAVTFNGTSATNFTVDSNTRIRANVPAGATTGKIAVTNSAGTGFSANDFAVLAITSFTPGDGPAGTTVTLTGSHFISVTSVTFNGGAAGAMVTSFTIDSDTQLRANVPAGATTGKIGVTNSAGTALSATDFIVTVVPVITSFTPNDGPVSTEITLTGSHFNATTSVTFNGGAAGATATNFTVDSDTQIRVNVPEGATTGKIAVTNSAGTGVSTDDFVVTSVPAVTSFTPTNGPVGTPVTITGHNFTGASSVTFNGTEAVSFTVDSGTEIRTNVPAGATIGKIQVANSAGIGASANDFIVTQAPVIISFTPNIGPEGTEVTIAGNNFAGASSVAFNSTVATSFTVDSNTRLRANVPVGATTGKISVTNSAGTGISGATFTVKPPPVISSFSPPGGPVGTEATITGNHFTGLTGVKFNGTPATSFTLVSNTQIRAHVPPGTTTGKISVTTADGTSLSANDFIVTDVPTITSFVPGNGPVGTEITITGANFIVVSQVTFNGTPVTSFTVDSDTQLRAEVPAGATTGKISITNTAGTGTSAADFIVTEVPAIVSFAPGNGPVGTEVTLTGAHFAAITGVSFNGTAATSFTVDSEAELRANVPAGATTGKIAVANSAGTGMSVVDFIVTNVPAITSFTPSDGPVNAEVTLTGSNFTAVTSVTFNGTEATNFTVDSNTQIRSNVPMAPAGATTRGQIGVTNSAGTALSEKLFTVTAVPVITSFTPGNGPIGTEVTLTGNNFRVITNVAFNGIAASFIRDSVTRIRAVVPEGAATGKISVTNSAGTGLSAVDFIVTAIAAFSPSNGPVGTEVTLSGINFTGITSVTFNGVAATGFTIDSDTQIRVFVPPGATTGRIGVTNASGTGFSENDFIVTFVPTITTLAPGDGPIGTEVTITGVDFILIGSVTFNGTPAANFTVDSDTRLRAEVPAGVPPGRNKIGITNSAGTGLSANDFIVTLVPVITSFTPADGAVGNEITLTGSHFAASTSVTFNGTAAVSFAVDSDTQLRATVPTGASTGKIAVTNSAGTGLSADDFVVTTLPAIASFTPGDAPAGAEVTVTGANFNVITGVTFNGVASSNFTVDSDTQLRAQVPAGATTGKIGVTNSAGTGLSGDDFIVTEVPVITVFTPADGPVGTEVTLTGAHFAAITSLTFNGTAAMSFSVNSDTQLRAIAPPGATTGKISVTNSAGTGLSADDFIVTDVPSITSFTPIAGLIGSEVTINGINFDAISSVTFNGIAAATFTVDSDTQLRATVPVGANTGTIAITNSAGTGFSPDDFTPIYKFNPVADSYINSSDPTSNFGAATTLRLRSGSPAFNSYLKFNVAGLGGVVQSAKLRFRATNDSPDGGSIFAVSNNYKSTSTPWTESGLNWNNAPALSGSALGTVGPVSLDTWIEIDVTSAITGNGTRSFGLSSNSTISVLYSSKEGAHPPELVIKTNSPSAPKINSFAPIAGPVGTEVTITGNNFTGATAVAFNGRPAVGFTVDSNTQIRANVPAGATTGKISVTTSNGTGLSPTPFAVTKPPIIAAFTPANGSVGTQVTITGNNFTGTSSVAFNGTAVANLTVDSDTQLRATVPTGATTGKISVTNADGTGISTNDFVVTAIPVIASFTPSSGPVGTEVILTGNHFTAITGVTFNGTPATGFTVVSNTRLRAVAPTAATTGKIGVTNSAGTGLTTTNFVVTAVPAIISFNPTNGPVGTEVTIAGNNFTGASSVTFNGKPATSFTVVSNTQLRANVPAGATTGKIGVINSAGSGSSATDFTVTQPPAITAFTPLGGPVGTEVTITGSSFTGVTGVAFNGTAATSFTVDSNTQLRANVPTGAATGKISVTNDAGTGLSATDFTVAQPPAITAFTPVSGPVGIEVTITGGDFTGVTGVAFNGTAATSFTADSPTQLRANVPTGSTTGKISVTNAAGTGMSAADFTVTSNLFTFNPVEDAEVKSSSPTTNFGANTILRLRDGSVRYNGYLKFNVTGLAGAVKRATLRLFVSTGSDNGGSVYLVSNNYTGGDTPWDEDALVWNNAPAIGGTPSIPSIGPVGAGTFVELEVTAAITGIGIYSFGMSSSSTSTVAYSSKEGTNPPQLVIETNSAPVITSFTPVSGSVGVEVTITGINFNGATGVAFNGTAATSFTVDSPTQLRASVPTGATTGKIRVTNADGSGVSANDFTVLQPPAITSFTPVNGSVGTEVTITGSNFTGVTGVAFSGTAATSFMVDSDTQLRTNVPTGATTGKISVTNAAGTSTSMADFTVMSNLFTFNPVEDAEVKSSSPTANFGANATLRLRDGSVRYSSYLKFNVTGLNGPVHHATLRLFVSAGSDNGGAVYLVSNNYAGSETPWDEDGLFWNNAPAFVGTPLNSISGPVVAGTVVELEVTAAITGNGLYSFGMNSSSASTVTYSSKEGTNAPELVIETSAAPGITAFTPVSGSVGAEVTITGSNFTGVTGVAFNGTAATSFTVDSPAQLRANVPTGATTGKISVTNADGSGMSATDFTVMSNLFTFNPVEDAEVKSSSPTTNFGANATLRLRDGSVRYVTYLKFNVTGVGAPVRRATLRLFVSVGSDNGGAVYLVSNNYAGSETPWDEDGLFWNNAPAFVGTPLNSISGPVVAGTVVELEVTAAITGNGLYSFGMNSSSASTVTYSSKEGTNAPELVIETSSAPGITAFTPVSGSVGAEVTITGSSFTGVTGVAFNGTAATSFTVDSPAQLRANVPTGATTGKISVTNADGSGTSAIDFTVLQPPIITAFTPVNGSVGTEVTVTGSNFIGATGIAFNGTAATSLTVDSPTQVRANVPTGATTGKISITNATGTGMSTADFAVMSNRFTFNPVEDAEVKSSSPTANFGANATLRLRDGSVQYRSYLKFNVAGLGGSATPVGVRRATLRLFVNDGSDDGGSIYVVDNNYTGNSTPWDEEGLVWNNAPAIVGAPLANVPPGGIGAGTFVELDVTSAITGNGVYSFGMLNSFTSVTTYSSKEGANPPQLVIETSSAPVAPSTLTFNPTHDAEVKSSFATTNYGANAVMRLRDGSVKYRSYLKFNVAGLGGPATPVGVQSAKLRLYVDEGSNDGGVVYLVSSHYAGNVTPWDENGLVWDNAPAITGAPLSTASQGVSAGTWVEFEVTAAITSDGIYSFGLINSSTTAVKYCTKEGANPPELVIRTGSASLPKPAEANPEPDEPVHEEVARLLPERLTLYPNHPNPFNAQTTIEYTLPLRASVQLVIFNVAGQPVRRLVNATQSAGQHRVVWDGKDEGGRVVTSGIYYYRLKVDKEILMRQMTILK